MTVRNVSDTARWVARYRAVESARPDALFHDHLADRLAGARGAEIVRTLPGAKRLGWVMVTRTCLFDEFVLRAVRHDGFDTVLNLAAGFDVRPYRLELPPTLRWIEVDLPPLLEEKRAALEGESPACRVESIPLDLADLAARGSLFARVGAESRRVLVLTEGLLAYLGPEEVLGLAGDLHRQPSIQEWVTDLASPFIMHQRMKKTGAQLKAANAAFRFAPEEGPEFFRAAGWAPAEFREMADEAHRLGREMSMAWLYRLLLRLAPPARRAELKRRYRSGVVRLRRT
jgi:methyltransferase (TIGR00027 family)